MGIPISAVSGHFDRCSNCLVTYGVLAVFTLTKIPPSFQIQVFHYLHTKLQLQRFVQRRTCLDSKMWIEVGVGQRTLVVHLRVIKLTFQMKYYSVELGYIAYGVMTFHRTQRSTNFKDMRQQNILSSACIRPKLLFCIERVVLLNSQSDGSLDFWLQLFT